MYNYEAVLRYKTVWIGYRNTILYTVIGTAVNIAVTMACAYPLHARICWAVISSPKWFAFTMIFSGGMIPSYLLIRDLRLMNTIWVMIIPGAMSAYNMMWQGRLFSLRSRNELLEASKIDVAAMRNFSSVFYCLYPRPILAVLGIYMPWVTGTATSTRFCILTIENCTRCRFSCANSHTEQHGYRLDG